MPYYAYCAVPCQLCIIRLLHIQCLLCHNKPTLCHTKPNKVQCYTYNVILGCSVYCGILCLLILCLLFHNKATIYHNILIRVLCRKMAVRYDTVRRYASIFAKKYGTVVRLVCDDTGTARWYAVSIKNPRLFAHCTGFLHAKANDSWSRR